MNNFDVFRTDDGTVSKYIHEDGSETAIKLVKSLQNILNPITNTIETRASERNKYSLFISVSFILYGSFPVINPYESSSNPEITGWSDEMSVFNL